MNGTLKKRKKKNKIKEKKNKYLMTKKINCHICKNKERLKK